MRFSSSNIGLEGCQPALYQKWNASVSIYLDSDLVAKYELGLLPSERKRASERLKLSPNLYQTHPANVVYANKQVTLDPPGPAELEVPSATPSSRCLLVDRNSRLDDSPRWKHADTTRPIQCPGYACLTGKQP